MSRAVTWVCTAAAAVGATAFASHAVILFPASGSSPALLRLGDGAGAAVVSTGALRLVRGSPGEHNAAVLGPATDGPRQWVEVRVKFRMRGGAHGWGVALVPAGAARKLARAAQWEAPNIPGAFAVGLDSYDPPTKNWFNAQGNIYGRPQREVSLHWDGLEQVKRLSPVEFRDRRPHELRLRIAYQVGGAQVCLWIDRSAVYRRFFIPEMVPCATALVAGARTGAVGQMRTAVEILEAAATAGPPTGPPVRPKYRCRVFDGEIINQARQRAERTVELPPAGERFGRVILTIKLEAPPEGIDPWDRSGSIYVYDGRRRYEIQRFITPFGRGYEWKTDVTDYLPLLSGRRNFELHISTWVGKKGWKVTADLDYYPGEARPRPVAVKTVWAGFFEYGNPERPLRSMLPPRTFVVPPGVTGAKLRVVVTGHGMHPATANAAEFFPARRTVVVNGRRFESLLWRTDCYLNPCRPQGGTWKFDRAGWCPGSLVRPWDIDISDLAAPGEKLRVEYIPQRYVNENRDKAKAWHLVEVQLIFYR